MMKKGILLFLLGIVALNVALVLSNSEDDTTQVTLNTLEAMANDENPGSGGSEIGSLQTYDCMVTERVIIGEDMNGNPYFKEVSFPGKRGSCTGDAGPCNPFSCTRILM